MRLGEIHMFNRAEIKNNAKKILSKNYWWIVLATLILGLVSGTGSGINFNFNSGSGSNYSQIYNDESMVDNSDIDEFGNIITDSSDESIMNFEDAYQEVINDLKGLFGGASLAATGVVILWVFLVVFAIALVISILVLNPLHVGCRRWFLKNRKEKPEIGEIAYTFSHGYKNTVKVMFLKDLYVFLWSLLLIIPGLIKSYEYRMIPYLLAENPEMDSREAFERSRKLMNGNKWDAFVLDLSFIGWSILSGFTCGILGLFYVSPYIALTDTELYVCLCQGREKYIAENNDNGNSSDNPYDGTNNDVNNETSDSVDNI